MPKILNLTCLCIKVFTLNVRRFNYTIFLSVVAFPMSILMSCFTCVCLTYFRIRLPDFVVVVVFVKWRISKLATLVMNKNEQPSNKK